MDIVHFFKRSKQEKAFRTLENGVVDLTSDVSDGEIVPVANPSKVVKRMQKRPHGESIMVQDFDNEAIECPVCTLNIAALSLDERESHVELCLLQPSKSTILIHSSPKKVENTSKLERSKRLEKAKRPKKALPDFKIITLYPHSVIVDGFCYAEGPSQKYFLSHFHSDHYVGLAKSWDQGVIYCTEITKNLAISMFKFQESKFVVLEIGKRSLVEDGLYVTALDANHCPGAAVFLFETNQKKVLHTGDFRVSKELIDLFKETLIDEIYLDTTYLDPQYSFYDQSLVVNSTSEFINDVVCSKRKGILDFVGGNAGGYVVLVGSYSIGKEKLYINIARRLNTKIHVSQKRFDTLQLSGMDMSMFSKEESECMVFVVSFPQLTDKVWLKRFAKKHIIKVRPTGWTFNRLKRVIEETQEANGDYYLSTINKVMARTMTKEQFDEQLKAQWKRGNTLSVPYSEHSSFKELTMFGSFLKWKKMIPTVDVNNREYHRWFEAWERAHIPYHKIQEHYNTANS